MTTLERGILIGATVLSLAVPAGIHLFGVRPLQSDIAKMRSTLDLAIAERASSTDTLSKQKLEWERVNDEVRRLYLFDLRQEANFQTVMLNRSNIGLIALSEILQKNGVDIDSLEPQVAENVPVNVAGVPKGGVTRRKFLIKATGRYTNLLAAFSGLKQLPPTIEVNSYQVAYLSEDQRQAKMKLEMNLSFNYLLTPEQLAQAPSEGNASGSVPVKTGSRPLEREPAGSLIETALRAIDSWLMPPALAQPPVRKPAKRPAYTIPISKDLQLGRAEPFLPLALPSNQSVAVKDSLPALPPLRIALLGLLVGGAEMPSAIIAVDGQRMRVKPGSMLLNGGEVLAIGGNYILVRHSGTIHRIALAQDADEALAQAAPATASAPASADPVPALPQTPLPQVPGGPKLPKLQ